jgi:hypothetical protein
MAGEIIKVMPSNRSSLYCYLPVAKTYGELIPVRKKPLTEFSPIAKLINGVFYKVDYSDHFLKRACKKHRIET